MNYVILGRVKNRIAKKYKLKSGEEAINKLAARVSDEIDLILADAVEVTKDEKRKTVLERDIDAAIEKNLGERGLTADELLEELLKQDPSELGRIIEGVDSHIRKERQKKK